MSWKFFDQMWAKPQYQYFPFVIGAFGWILWRNAQLAEPRIGGFQILNRVGVIAAAAVAWALLALAYLANSPWLAMISAIILIGSCFLRISREWRVPYLWGIWAMLWLIIPPPMNRDQQLISWLQQLSSQLSSVLLDWCGVDHLMEGNVLLMPDKQLFVDEACSGIVSVLSIIACAAIYGIWRNRPAFHVVALALAGVGWATLMNVFRISSIAIAYNWYGLDWSSGTSHEILGLIIFTFTFLALISTDYLLLAMLAPIAVRDGVPLGEELTYGASLVAIWDRLQQVGTSALDSDARKSFNIRPVPELGKRFAFGIVGICLFALLGSGQLLVNAMYNPTFAKSDRSIRKGLTLEADDLNVTIDGVRKIGFKPQERDASSAFGNYSRIYEYKDTADNLYLVSCDFPFGPTWHDLTICYLGVGWSLTDVSNIRPPIAPGDTAWEYVEANFDRPDGTTALVEYSVFDETGRTLHPPSRTIFGDIWHTLKKEYQERQTEKQFQIQVFTTANGGISDQQRATAGQLLLAARQQFRKFISNDTLNTELANR
jgi:exosortase